mgnify:CR=1 FL=1
MKILAIARNTFREAVRDRVFALVGAFGLVLMVSSIVLSPLSVGAQQKLVADIGLSGISIFAVLVVLFVGSGLVHKELDKRTIMTLLSKPVSRLEYLLGKYVGLLFTIVTMMALMAALFGLALLATGTQFEWVYLLSIGLTFCEMVLVTAIVIFFSSFTGPLLTGLFTMGIFISGRTLSDVLEFAHVTENPTVARTVEILRNVVPNLDLFDIRSAAVHGLPIDPGHIAWAVAYMALYSVGLVVAAEFVFRRREFK